MDIKEINDRVLEILSTAENQIASLHNGQSNFILEHAETQLHSMVEYLQKQRRYEEWEPDQDDWEHRMCHNCGWDAEDI